MIFTILLFLSAIFIASCSAFFSVKGIALLFSGSFWSVVVMASSLEFGKIISTSFLYRYWEKLNKILRFYLLTAVIFLMGITSLGVFGFLSQAFFSTKSSTDAIESQMVLLQNKKSSLENQITSNNERIKVLTDTRKNQESNLAKALDQSTTTTVTKSGGFFGKDTEEKVVDKGSLSLKAKSFDSIQSNIASLDSNTEKINSSNQNLLNEINVLDKDIISLNTQVIKSDIGTYKFIAQAFDTDIETVVKWFIILIVIVFDPLAIALLISFNMITKKNSEDNPAKIIKKPMEVIKEIYHRYKRGTKKTHNPNLFDPKFNH